MASTFDMAIDHFWRAQQATDQLDCLGQMANGLQLFCAALRGNSPERMFDVAIDHFWRAQQATNELDCAGQMANGLQLFCAAVKK